MLLPAPPERLAAPLLGLAVALAAAALLEPRALAAPVLAGAFALTALALGADRARAAPVAALALAFALAAAVGPQFFRADSISYYAYLRSAFFDHDLHFANEMEQWRAPVLRLTETGRPENQHPVGPALLWSPFFLLAHSYVKLTGALGLRQHAADGYSLPYYRATALGTITWAVLGSTLLAQVIARRLGAARAAAVVVVAVAASSIGYYVVLVPGMAHALAYAVACAALWALDRVDRQPTLRAWVVFGALCGLLALVRWQAAVFVLAALPVAAAGWRRRELRLPWLLAAAAALVLAFSPQLAAWRVLFGRFLTMPQGGGWIDWTSPRLLQVLVSADRGFFTWTPLMALGVAGLLPATRWAPRLALGGLFVFAATACVNGGLVHDWNGSDSFGSRRFDVVVPFAALGLAAVGERLAAWAGRRPWLVPALAAALAVAWNLGLMQLYQTGEFLGPAPLDRLAAAQGAQAARGLRRAAETLAPERARPFLYDVFVGEYLYENVSAGPIEMVADDGRLLREGWSGPKHREGWPPFRWAFHPQACVAVPLLEATELSAGVTVRVPARLDQQRMRVVIDGRELAAAVLSTEWQDVRFELPVRRGENRLCFVFDRALPGQEGAQVGAAVSRIDLP